MTEIPHDLLEGHLKTLTPGGVASCYLVHGEEMLRQKAAKALCGRLLGPNPGSHQVDRVDGDAVGAVSEALARVNTYSLLGDVKVVILADTRVFHDALDSQAFLEKARTAQQDDQMAKAAKALMAVLGFHHLGLDEIDADGRRRLLAAADLDPENDDWLEALIRWCRQQEMKVPDGGGEGDILIRAIERGFPAGHHLILTAESVDRRRKLYKSLEAVGVVVDCAVPEGDRKADREIQQRVLQDQMRAILEPRGKRLGPEAYAELMEMTGFDLRTFAANLEKLIDYTGARPAITAEDVRQVLSRSKRDPIYAIANAVGDGRLDQALKALDSLLGAGSHPLQVLAALINQLRRWMLARSFLDGPEGRVWDPQMSYNDFQRLVVPVVKACDQRLREQIGAWQPEPDGAKGKRRKVDTDLVLVKNPQSTYPVYSLFKQTQRFSSGNLRAAMKRLAEADRLLKSTAGSERLVLEGLIFFLCGRGKGEGARP